MRVWLFSAAVICIGRKGVWLLTKLTPFLVPEPEDGNLSGQTMKWV